MSKEYSKLSHTHCWNQKQPSACGIPLDKHTQCCLCDTKQQSAVDRILNEFERRFPIEDFENLDRSDYEPFKEGLAYLLTTFESEIRAERDRELRIGFLRQWLNEDRITDPKKMVTNEEIEHMLGITTRKEQIG